MKRKTYFRILVVDDDPLVLEAIDTLLERPDQKVMLARSAADLESYYDQPAPDVVLLDWHLPECDGLEMLPTLRTLWPAAQIVLMSGFATSEAVVEALRRGAFHFKTKPFSGDDLRHVVDTACAFKQHAQPAAPASPEAVGGRAVNWPVAHSPKMKEVLRLVARVAASDVCVLITGESGTGKEVIAGLMHALSLRAKGPLVTVNCAAMPRDLIEAELFGSVKGAYTGSVSNRNGMVREAADGTLFLDEIAEMNVQTQAKLLRLLQQKEFRPVGGHKNLKAECRIIAATNREPEQAIQQGTLRGDLYYRIGAITINIPPLRERREDILPLANLFIRSFAQAGHAIEGLTPAAEVLIQQFPWPGNVRQLENELQRAVLMCEHNRIDVTDLSIAGAGAELYQPRSRGEEGQDDSGSSILKEGEKAAILAVLKACGGNKRRATRKLGISPQTLYNKLKYYAITGPALGSPKPLSGEASRSESAP